MIEYVEVRHTSIIMQTMPSLIASMSYLLYRDTVLYIQAIDHTLNSIASTKRFLARQ